MGNGEGQGVNFVLEMQDMFQTRGGILTLANAAHSLSKMGTKN